MIAGTVIYWRKKTGDEKKGGAMGNNHNLYIPQKEWDKLNELRSALEERSPSSTVRLLINDNHTKLKERR